MKQPLTDMEQAADWLNRAYAERDFSSFTRFNIEVAFVAGKACQAAEIAELLAALQIARKFMSIAADCNVDEAEINGQVRRTYDWIGVVDAAISNATGSAK